MMDFITVYTFIDRLLQLDYNSQVKTGNHFITVSLAKSEHKIQFI